MIYTTRYDILLNYLLCAADMLILARLMSRMYGPVIRHKRLLTGISALGILALMLMPAPYDNTFLTVPLSFLLLWFYPKNAKKKLLFESCLFTIVFSFIFIFNDITNLLPKRGEIWIMWYYLAYHAILWCLLVLCLKLCRSSNENLPLSLWIVFLLIPFTTLASSVLALFLLDAARLNRPVADLMHLFLQATFLFINLALFDLFRRFSLHYQKEQEQALLGQQLKAQEQHYRKLLEANARIDSIRHDMKNHLQTISLLCRQGENQELIEYLNTTTQELSQGDSLISTGNPAIDALLGLKISEMREKGIRCVPRLSIPKGLSFSFSDAVTILGNLLDNAIASSSEWKTSPEILLSIAYQQNTLLFHMENPCSADTLHAYGTGMHNVVRAARKYSGTVQTALQNHTYITDVVLYHL